MNHSITRRPYHLRGALKEFAWGMDDPHCWVSMLCAFVGSPGPFAEVWFGDHEKGSASIEVSRGQFMSVREICARHPELLFDIERPLRKIPFQGKLLCVGAPLSIQLHPKKEDAVRLHRKTPGEYPAEEPKNEAGIAVSTVELLYGFRPIDRIFGAIDFNPEFKELLGAVGTRARLEAMANPEQYLRDVCMAILEADDETVERCSEQLYDRLADFVGDGLSPEEIWVLKMKEFYPKGDRGLFYFFVLNLVTLQPGQSLAIPVGRLHAYLSGQLIEIMQSGDDVIRVAMTTKFKDPDEVLACGEFESIDPAALIGGGTFAKDARRIYQFPPFEFAVESFEDPGEFTIQPSDCPQLFVSLGGVADLATAASETLAIVRSEAALFPAASHPGKLIVKSGRLICFRMQ